MNFSHFNSAALSKEQLIVLWRPKNPDPKIAGRYYAIPSTDKQKIDLNVIDRSIVDILVRGRQIAALFILNKVLAKNY